MYSRWFVGRGTSFPTVYLAVLTAVVAWGLMTLGPPRLDGLQWASMVWAVPIGVAAGVGAKRLDRILVRALAGARRPTPWNANPAGFASRQRAVAVIGAPAARRRPGFEAIQQGRSHLDPRAWRNASILAIAAGEECLYRGVLLEAARLLPGTSLFAAACTGLVLAFAASHVWFGTAHVVAKLPLGAIALLLVLVQGTLVPAVAAHMAFNLLTLHELDAQAAGRGDRHAGIRHSGGPGVRVANR